MKDFILHFKLWLADIYYQSSLHYLKTGKVALCCIAKNENLYIREFVEYYRSIGFDKIYIYDNNDESTENVEYVIKDYVNLGFCEILNFRGRKECQLLAYHDCYIKHNKEFDWIAFFDCDEFLTFSSNTNIHAYLNQHVFRKFQMIHFNWLCYGDNELLDYDGRGVIERFVSPVSPLDFDRGRGYPENDLTKSIIRGNQKFVFWLAGGPHAPFTRHIRCCNDTGNEIDPYSYKNKADYNGAYLRHYVTKTIGEWVKIKSKRGYPDQSFESASKGLTLAAFFSANKYTEEKMNYAKQCQ